MAEKYFHQTERFSIVKNQNILKSKKLVDY